MIRYLRRTVHWLHPGSTRHNSDFWHSDQQHDRLCKRRVWCNKATVWCASLGPVWCIQLIIW